MSPRGYYRKSGILSGTKNPQDIHHPLVNNGSGEETFQMICRSDAESEAAILLILAALGMAANMTLMITIMQNGKLRR